MITVTQLIQDNYSKAWQSRMMSKVQSLGVNLDELVTPHLLAYLSNHLHKLKKLLTNWTTENDNQQKASTRIDQRLSVRSIDEKLNSTPDKHDDRLSRGNDSFVEPENRGLSLHSDAVSMQQCQHDTETQEQEDSSDDSFIRQFIQKSYTKSREINKDQHRLIKDQHKLVKDQHELVEGQHELVMQQSNIALAAIGLARMANNGMFREVECERQTGSIEPTTIEVKSDEVI